MKLPSKWVFSVSAVVLGVAPGMTVGAGDAQQKNQLVGQEGRGGADAGRDDGRAWQAAAPLTFKVVGGRGPQSGSTEVPPRPLHGRHRLLPHAVQGPDQQHPAEPWQKQADGSWKKLGDPNDKGGDNNLYYEDKWAIIWNISSPGLRAARVLVRLPHRRGQALRQQVHRRRRRAPDMWHMKGVRTGTVGQIDDQYVDNTRYDKDKAPEAGRKSDPKTGGGYTDNRATTRRPRSSHSRGTSPRRHTGSWTARRSRFDDSKYKAGDEVPGDHRGPVHRGPRRHPARSSTRTACGPRVLAEARDRQRVRRAVQRSQEGVRRSAWPCSTTPRCVTPIHRES